jgi:hypothetical protein
MDNPFLIRSLSDNAERIKALVTGFTDDEARWKPNGDSWSLLEVINHLLDEEREDFRVRLDIILYHPDDDWPPIDPEAWVLERGYNQRCFPESLANFLSERKDSLAWLSEIGSPKWDTVYSSPFGSMRAGDIFAAWVTHDHLHMRQIIEIHRSLIQERAKPYSLDYAGEW